MLSNIILITLTVYVGECAKILGVFFFPSISHQHMYQSIWKELALRGHDVTIITTNILGDPNIKNLREIDVSFAYNRFRELAEFGTKSTETGQPEISTLMTLLYLNAFSQYLIEEGSKHKAVQKLLQDKERQFDLILVECLHPLTYGFAARFRAPVIGVSALGPLLNSYDAVGNPTHPIMSPDYIFKLEEKISFYQRLSAVLYSIWYRLLYHWYILPSSDKVARKIFGDDIPYLGDVERNISLLLLNVNRVLHTVRANVPAIIELSQMHIRKTKPLPDDVQRFLDDARDGVIYFSLDSHLKSAFFPTSIQKVIIEAFAELPYKVLWKCEKGLPSQPKNVMSKKWLPQYDILGHANTKAFVTQEVAQSLEEAIINEVPLVGIPIFDEQPMNVKKIVEIGIGKRVDIADLTKETLKAAIIDVVQNKSYKENVRRMKNILTDEPMTGPSKAAWWIEYVIRHQGARHLRSPTVDISWAEYLFVDVVLFLFVIASISFYLIYKMFASIIKCKFEKLKND